MKSQMVTIRIELVAQIVSSTRGPENMGESSPVGSKLTIYRRISSPLCSVVKLITDIDWQTAAYTQAGKFVMQ